MRRNQGYRKRRNPAPAVIVIILAGIAAAGGLYFHHTRQTVKTPKPAEEEAAATATTLTEEEKEKHPYLGDVYWQEMYPYLSLYDYPFDHSGNGSYIKNADLNRDTAQMCVDRAEQFIQAAYSIDPVAAAEDEDAFADGVAEASGTDDGMFDDGLTLYGESDGTMQDFTRQNASYCIEKKLFTKAEFNTNTSLVWYETGRYYCRGMLEINENGSSTRYIPADVMLFPAYEDDGTPVLKVWGIYGVEGYPELETDENGKPVEQYSPEIQDGTDS